MFVLAKETGWPLESILWDVPLCMLHQAEHVFMYMNNAKLRRPYTVTGTDLCDIQNMLGL
ncbi:MAG: hypothetical protein EBR82_43165 [Caulobacteraceae bacterium]|nr:hypothetical protein [Caulobacteraceae bacterium]